ncbi:formate dehydrogenase accessory protein FdhE [Desulfovibrio sulfodismutans]|uniref:Formate dehydrogenase accessory protein FdhE n=1 Tax=Desulfolutivibrio sulfodismutans TaxID=63561 RepID=A0A7K3NPI9_9BACT|nr:formate dehydrogenase accessory protein FdhE [Desulfolutivibrio sulfodismutans]NDY58112.1 formate dehydrogenase accessory protein FdhE [Desulfolutivibrio sulfodismutans]QLA14090.1 formate dehydrogenase accessory protein FdhE [Desulfolutivibrio sulfodismutans DSM 3696]
MRFDERKYKIQEEAKLLVPPPRSEAVTAIARVFAALADRRAACLAALPETPPVVELDFDPALFEEGTPLLSSFDPACFLEDFTAAAGCLFPGMAELFPAVAGEISALADAISGNPAVADACLAALWTEGEEAGAVWEKVGALSGVSAAVAAFAAGEALKVCLTRMAPLLAPQVQKESWFRGYCPICGSYPDAGCLLPKEPEESEYLISKSGQLHMHCARCGHVWRYVRLKCPACETTDHEKFASLIANDRDDERVYTCSECGIFFPCVDLTGGRQDIRLENVALDLMHLEFVAAERGFRPLVVQAWNTFA